MDAKLVNPFIDALTTVMPQMGFDVPVRSKMEVRTESVESSGISVIVGFTKELRGNVVYNMTEEAARFIASKMMMGMPVPVFDDMAQSAISEMSNMLTANAATNITALGYDVDISTPSLSIGAGFKIKVSQEQFLAVEMDLGGAILELNIAVQA